MASAAASRGACLVIPARADLRAVSATVCGVVADSLWVSQSLPHSRRRSTWPTLTLWSSFFERGGIFLSSGRDRTSG
jgi:hypothetical protein